MTHAAPSEEASQRERLSDNLRPEGPENPNTATCKCGIELSPTLLLCPSCHRIVHAARIEELCDRAAALVSSPAATASPGATDPKTEAMAMLREARALVPDGTKQAKWIDQKIDELGHAPSAVKEKPAHRGATRSGFMAAAVGGGLILWKFKALLIVLLSKIKLLALGLTKAGTLLSMLLSFGVYWKVFGWPYALGLVLSIYVHEMGHVVTLHRYGIPASAPMFIPGLGAFVRLQVPQIAPKEDARTGLAGPAWGLGAAVFSYGLAWSFESKILFAIAASGALINLFNLIPIWQLDGGRGIRSQSKNQRLALAALAGGIAYSSDNELLWAIALLLGVRGFERRDETADAGAWLLFAFLLVSLTVVCKLAPPT